MFLEKMGTIRGIPAVIGIVYHMLLLHSYAGPGPLLPSEPYPRNGDSLTIEEIKAGASVATTKTVDSIISLYSNTYTWNLTSDTSVKLWEGVGRWPGSFPLALQVFVKEKCVAAEKLDFPASSNMIDLVAFSHHNMFVLNLTCRHRHNDYESKYAFSVTRLGIRIVNGGPVISDELVLRKRAAGEIYEAEQVESPTP